MPPEHIAEFQGLYGPFTILERVLQKIWLRQDFDAAAARLADSRALEIEHPGAWNLLGGPDFTGARLRIEGQPVEGDVEVHFRASDWAAHHHDSNPAFGRVVLHVLLFPPDPSARPARRLDGAELPALALLPRLHRDLEEYAADDALERLTARDDWRRLADLAGRPQETVRELLRAHARIRWDAKVRYARLRIARMGFETAAHQTALEILGYRFNRAPMLAVASRFPLPDWRATLDPTAAFASATRTWRLQGVRPANHPRRRLEQYARWVRQRPDWTLRLGPLLEMLPVAAGPDGGRKVRADIQRCRQAFVEGITGGVLEGSRLDTLACDGFLPLMSAAGVEHFDSWFGWYLGDVPVGVRNGLRRLGLMGQPGHPACHGFGQGLIGWLLANESGASA